MATYPLIQPGMTITAGLLNAIQPNSVWKTVNTDRDTTTTLADDPDLSVQLAAGATYRVQFRLFYGATDAARFKTAWTVPPGASGNKTVVGPDQGVILSGTSSGGTGRWGVHVFSTSCTYGTRDSTSNLCAGTEEGTIFTTSAGTLALQWAQATSNANAARLAAGSMLTVTRLA
ncbi:hypothetical protein ACH4JZ_18305 [Streptomyces sp. NPDC017615]|uniref:hypothetical protein n=1 Tax=Streptomyces sp. NPDC017615 TaxID=3365003 RepID=UPI0037BCFDD4